MDVNALVSYLSDKLKRSVEVIPPKTDAVVGGGEKKVEKEASGEKKMEKEDGKGDTKEKEGGDEKAKGTSTEDGGGDKKEKEDDTYKEKGVANDESGEAKEVRVKEANVEANKMDYYGQTHNSYYTMPPPMHINQGYINHGYYDYGDEYGITHDRSHNYQNQGYYNQGYNLQQYPQTPGFYDAHQMFSDENPNASCYVM